jgi:hypothetical protein
VNSTLVIFFTSDQDEVVGQLALKLGHRMNFNYILNQIILAGIIVSIIELPSLYHTRFWRRNCGIQDKTRLVNSRAPFHGHLLLFFFFFHLWISRVFISVLVVIFKVFFILKIFLFYFLKFIFNTSTSKRFNKNKINNLKQVKTQC